MVCCPANPLDAFHSASLESTSDSTVRDLTKRVNLSKEEANELPEHYKTHPIVRIVFVAAVIAAMTAYVLLITGQITTFPQNFVNSFQNINWTHFGVGVGICTVLVGGAALVIYRVMHKKDPYTQKAFGKLWGRSQWDPAFFTYNAPAESKNVSYCRCKYFGRIRRDPNGKRETTPPIPGYVDRTSLDENGNGKAYFYGFKPCFEHYAVNTEIMLTTPFHAIGAIVYNTIRLAIIPFYIAVCIAIETIKGEALFKKPFSEEKQRRYQWIDIPKKMGKTVFRIVKAPFYATAMIFAALYSFIDPMNGRKLGSFIERDWNEGVTRSEGYWSVGGPQSLFKFEGGGGPERLGKNGFFIAGCWQPFAVAEFEDEKITAMSLTRAVNPEKGYDYDMRTYCTLLAENQNAYESLTKPEHSDSQEDAEES